jgi:hypothetical protein
MVLYVKKNKDLSRAYSTSTTPTIIMITPRGGGTPRKRVPVPSPRSAATSASGVNGNGGDNVIRVDLGKFRKNYMEIRVDKTTGDISKRTQRRFTTIIENAMALGQTTAVLGKFVENQHFNRYDANNPSSSSDALMRAGDPLCKSTPVRNMWTMLPLHKHGDSPFIIRINEKLKTVLKWLLHNGVHYCFTSVMVEGGGLLISYPPDMANWVILTALFLPEFPDPQDHPGPFLSLWNDVRTPKCLDTTMCGVWVERVVKGIKAGVTRVVLCTLHEGDYEEYVDSTYDWGGATEAWTRELVCVTPRDHLTMQPLNKIVYYKSSAPQWIVDARFSDMVSWVTYHRWQWTLLFATTPSVKKEYTGMTRISRWAYFTVLLDPLTLGDYDNNNE